jgi:phage tail-like protein
MTQFSVNPHRLDPYKNFKFRVKWDAKYVPGVSKITALRRSTEVISHREGGDPSLQHVSPGQTTFAPITLERGVTHDTAFEDWANLAFALGGGPSGEMSLKNFRKDVILEFHNEAGVTVLAYKVFRCWVSEYQALSDLDAEGNLVAIESITLQNEGWERDPEVQEPPET